FGRVPVGRRNDGLAGTEGVGQRARRTLGFIQIWSNVDVGRADEVLQGVEIYEAVVENDILLDSVLGGQNLETHPVGFAALAKLVRMGCAYNHVHHFRKLRCDRRKCVEDVLDALIWGEQPECEQYRPSADAEFLFDVIRIDKRYVRDPVLNQVDLSRRSMINVLQ